MTNGVHEDIISQLPDDVLILIIARIPTKTAVSTSMLSKRWRNLYKFLSSFKLHGGDLVPLSRHPHESRGKLSIDRLEKFLKLCSNSKIDDFDLSICLSKSKDIRLEQCIYYLGKSGIDKLFLSFFCRESHSYASFPCDLLCELTSLKYLRLHYGALLPNMKSKFYSLQSLQLSVCILRPDSLECVLSNCLSLQSLSIIDCLFPGNKLCVSSPSLKTLSVVQYDYIREIELHACNLSEFKCSCRYKVNFVFDYVPQLETMYLWFDEANLMPYVFGELAKHVPGIKFLTFSPDAGLDQTFAMETLSNLRRVEISVRNSNLLALTPYLMSCPLLEELHLNLTATSMALELALDDVGAQSEPIVICHSKLKVVEMTGFLGMENEIAFALCILKSAIVLHQIRFVRCLKSYLFLGERWSDTGCLWSEGTLRNIQQSLRGQAVSTTAKLIFQHRHYGLPLF